MINIMFLMCGAKPPRGDFFLIDLITNLRKDMFNPLVIYVENSSLIEAVKKRGIATIHIPIGGRVTSLFPSELLFNPFKLLKFIFHFVASGYFIKLGRILRNHHIDVMYARDGISKTSGGIVAKLLKIKVIGHCHNDFSGKQFRGIKNYIVGKALKAIDLIFLDRIIAVAENVRSCFKGNKGFKKTIVIYNGVDTSFFNPEKTPDGLNLNEFCIGEKPTIIGCIGSLERLKGQSVLFKAIEGLISEGNNKTNIFCLVCGDGPEKEHYMKEVEERGLRKKVLFMGFQNDVRRVLKTLDVLVVPSYQESCCMSAIEAMSMRVPVVGSKVGGLVEIIKDGETGILVPPGDYNSLSQALTYLIGNPQVRKRLGVNGRKRVLEKFTSEQNTRKTEEIILNILKKRPSGWSTEDKNPQ